MELISKRLSYLSNFSRLTNGTAVPHLFRAEASPPAVAQVEVPPPARSWDLKFLTNPVPLHLMHLGPPPSNHREGISRYPRRQKPTFYVTGNLSPY
jgi:hypothetical protein